MPARDFRLFDGIYEYEDRMVGEALQARSYSMNNGKFYGLGPPDMCHAVKNSYRGRSKDNFSAYHFVHGADTSSPASIAAYVKSLIYLLDETNKKESSKWVINSCTYCCYNAFSKVDIRVRVCFPGGVKAYYIDMGGNTNVNVSQNLWDEAYVSTVVRAIIHSQEDFDKVEAGPEYEVRKLDPLPEPEVERAFLQSVERVFLDGHKLGSDSFVFLPNLQVNYLVSALLSYFFNAGRAPRALELFRRLETNLGIDLSYLCTQCYLEMNEEILALECMSKALKDGPNSCGCMLLQIDFLIRKKEYYLAAEIAGYAVVYYSSEFRCWEKLIEVYMAMGDYASALLTLNTCTFNLWTPPNLLMRSRATKEYGSIRSLPKDLTPSKYALKAPKSSESIYSISNISRSSYSRSFRQFYCLSPKAVTKRAYLLLTRMSSKLGWLKLLKYRAHVFVMQNEFNEYRKCISLADSINHDAPGSTSRTPNNSKDRAALPGLEASPTELSKEELIEDSDAAHSTGDRSNSELSYISHPDATPDEGMYESGRESGRESGHDESGHDDSPCKPHPEDHHSAPTEDSDTCHSAISTITKGNDESNRNTSGNYAHPRSHRKGDPKYKHSAVSAKSTEDPSKRPVESSSMLKQGSKSTDSLGFVALQNKHLCNKLLDSTFMAMYAEVKYYMWFREEIDGAPESSRSGSNPETPYQKIIIDWEIFGDLAYRYGDVENAIEAYKHCVDASEYLSSYLKLLKILATRNDIYGCLGLIVGIEIFYWTRHIQKTYPSFVAECIITLIKEHGLSKVHNHLISMNLPKFEYDLLNRYFKYAELFGIEGAYP